MNPLSILLAVSIAQSAPTPKEGPRLLDIGDLAPKIRIEKCIQGAPVPGLQSGKIYVLDFWATWCAPCVKGLPHLSELQARHEDAGVIVIGLSDEPDATIRAFLANDDWKEKVLFTLATDPEKVVSRKYMAAAGKTAIPTSFVVGREGRIEWIGNPIHPPGELARVLEAVIAGTHDREKYRARLREEREAQARVDRAWNAFEAAVKGERWSEALDLNRRLFELTDRNPAVKLQWYEVVLVWKKDAKQAADVARELIDQYAKDASVLAQLLAMTLQAAPDLRNLDVAFEAANQACRATNFSNGPSLAIVAQIHYERGDLEEAVKWQRRSLEHPIEDWPEWAEQARKTLSKYESELAADGK